MVSFRNEIVQEIFSQLSVHANHEGLVILDIVLIKELCSLYEVTPTEYKTILAKLVFFLKLVNDSRIEKQVKDVEKQNREIASNASKIGKK